MSYNRYFMIAMPTAAGISGNTISNSSSGLFVRSLATNTTTAAMAVAYRTHLSWSRCSWPERRKRTIMEITPTSNTSVPASWDTLYGVTSGATTVTGSRRLGKSVRNSTLDNAVHSDEPSPPRTATQITGRHRDDGGRPSGNRSGVRKNSGPTGL